MVNINESNNLEQLLTVLESAELPENNIVRKAPEEDVKNLSKLGKWKFNRLFHDMDTKVLFLSKENYEKIYMEFNKDNSMLEFIEEVFKNAMQVDCFDVPILINELGKSYSSTIPMYWQLGNLASDIPIIFSEVNCSRVVSGAIDGMYIHECVHMLFNRNKKIKDPELNSEFLSIFIETLILSGFYETDINARYEQMNRWGSFKLLISKLKTSQEDINFEYLKSFIFSEYFSRYIFTLSLEDRLQVVKEVSFVLEGKLQLNQLLEKYNISLNNQDCINTAIKSIKESEKFWKELNRNRS